MGSAERDRAIGALVGLAAGDALGAGYEFDPKPPYDIDMVGGGAFGWGAGEWTDDTQMAICIAEVAATGNLDAAAVGQRFLEWYRSGPTDIGNQTAAVLSRAHTGAELPAAAEASGARCSPPRHRPQISTVSRGLARHRHCPALTIVTQ